MRYIQLPSRSQMIDLPLERIRTHHQHLMANGFYLFLKKNLLRIILSLGFLVILVKMINQFFNLSYIDNIIWDTGRIIIMYFSFFLSESFFLGLLPPDLFIVWTAKFHHFFWMLSALGILSYLGGIIAFILGKNILKRKLIHANIEKRISRNTKLVKKWGALIIVIAALLPLPYTPVSLASGMTNFSLKSYCYLGITRILRFYIYGFVIVSFI